MLDIFNSEAFSVVELTQAINVVPNSYGRVREMGLFANRGVPTTAVGLEIKNGVLNLLPTTVRGGNATKGASGKRKLEYFTIPNIAYEDAVLAEEVQNVRAFGSENRLQGVMEVVNDKLATMRAKHAITLEWHRVTALRGVILDSDGSTLLDLFTRFGVTQKVVDFKLGTSTTNIKAKLDEVKNHIADNLLGEVMRGVHAFCSQSWWDDFTAHPEVKDAFLYYEGQKFLREDNRANFKFNDVTFEVYRGKASDIEGNVRDFIPDGDVRFFPVGTAGTFVNYFGPADFMETVNTPGIELYAKQERMKFDRGVELHTQSNPLPLVTRPALLVRGHSSD